MSTEAKHPWRVDTNSRYKDVVKLIINFSIATLSIPIIFARSVLGIETSSSLIAVFDLRIFIGWGLNLFAVLNGIVFYYASGQWIRLAWELPTFFLGIKMNDKIVEKILDLTFWFATISFLSGFILTFWFIVSYTN